MEIVIVLTGLLSVAFAIDPNVTIIDEYPKMTVGPGGRKELIATKDKDVFMTCVVHNKPADEKVEWRGIAPDNTNILISEDQDSKDAYRYQVDQPTAISWRVKIQNIQIADSMRYMCQVEIGEQKYATEERYIIVTEKPQIMDLQTSSNQLVEEDEPTRLTCNCTGHPVPIIKWSMLAGGLLPNGGEEYQGSVLDLGKAEARFRGYYKCTCANFVGKDSRIVQLQVKSPPEVVAARSKLVQAYGYRKTLECIVNGYPVPEKEQIVWSIDGRPISPNSGYVKYIQGAMNRISTKLILYSVGPNDIGTYTCSAKTIKGDGEAYIELAHGAPTPDITGEIISGSVSVSFSLTTLLMFVIVALLHTCKN